ALSEHVDRLIRKALDADPELRPPSCRAFLYELLGAENAVPEGNAGETDLDLFYVDYENAQGNAAVAVGTSQNLRRTLRQGLLGDPAKIYVGRYRAGPAKTPLKASELKDCAADLDAAGPRPSETVRSTSSNAGCVVSCAPDVPACPSDRGPFLEKF